MQISLLNFKVYPMQNSISEHNPTPLPQQYADYIHQAFIDPIRHVTVVDDEYPTFDKLIKKEHGEEINPYENENIGRLKKIIDYCHTKKSWGIDVHDDITSKNQSGCFKQQIDRLNHSDLIVLDYHLGDQGEQARNTIEALSQNDHFNMVLVHTKVGDNNDLHKTFNEVLMRLTSHNSFDLDSIFNDDVKDGIIENFIDKYRPESNFLDEDISYDDTLKLFKFFQNDEQSFIRQNDGLNQNLKSIENLFEKRSDINLNDVARWYLRAQLKRNIKEEQAHFLPDQEIIELPKYHWSKEFNYIATGSVFVSVIAKKDGKPENELIKPLKEALAHYNPTPMHLLMVKLRTLIEEKGLDFAQKVITNEFLHIGWLYRLFESHEDKDEFIASIWQHLAYFNQSKLSLFLSNLISSLEGSLSPEENNSNEIINKFFPLEAFPQSKTPNCRSREIKSYLYLHAFIQTNLQTKSHLTTGTILKNSQSEQYFLCLSPACDVQPRSMNGHTRPDQSHNFKKFILVEMTTIKDEDAKKEKDKSPLKQVNENGHIYILYKNQPKVFMFDKKSNPKWYECHSLNEGSFTSKQSKYYLDFYYVPEQSVDTASTAPTVRKITSEVIAELRYEYALNFLQKFGGFQTRVGLNGKQLPKKTSRAKKSNNTQAQIETDILQ